MDSIPAGMETQKTKTGAGEPITLKIKQSRRASGSTGRRHSCEDVSASARICRTKYGISSQPGERSGGRETPGPGSGNENSESGWDCRAKQSLLR